MYVCMYDAMLYIVVLFCVLVDLTGSISRLVLPTQRCRSLLTPCRITQSKSAWKIRHSILIITEVILKYEHTAGNFRGIKLPPSVKVFFRSSPH